MDRISDFRLFKKWGVKNLPEDTNFYSNQTRREVGRIMGVYMDHCFVTPFMSQNVQLLSEENPLIADWDCCELDGHKIETLDDWSQVLAKNKLSQVRGAFTLAWISSSGKLTLARDAIGERTLFYSTLKNGFAFASSISLLLNSNLFPRTLNMSSVALFLSVAYIPGPRTLVEGILELAPGTILKLENGKISHRRFWQLPTDLDPELDEAKQCANLRGLLELAISRRLPRAGSIAASLSGGVDSSLVVAILQKLWGNNIDTFSISFGKDYRNELEFSNLVARHCGVRHNIVELTPEIVSTHLDSTIEALSQPIGDPLTVPNSILFKTAAMHSRVLFNGEGGDPCFGGPKNLPMILSELYGQNPEHSRAQNYLRSHQKCYDELAEIFTPEAFEFAKIDSLPSVVSGALGDPRWPDFIARLQALNIQMKGGYQILPKIDQLSNVFGILPRSPLFDRDVVAFSMRLPSQKKQYGAIEKYLLKQAVKDLLPAVIIDRLKSGMMVPVEGWFRKPLARISKERLLGNDTLNGIIRRDYLERLCNGSLSGFHPRHGVKIWLLITLEAWIRKVLRP